MPDYPWFNEFPGAITITDTDGVILEMNDMAVEDVFKSSGGRDLIGKNVLDCHPEPAAPADPGYVGKSTKECLYDR